MGEGLLFGGRDAHQAQGDRVEVMGGTYNSSTKDWGPISRHILQLVQRVLDQEAPSIRAAFGDWRHAHSQALVKRALDARSTGSRGSWIRFVDALSARTQTALDRGRSMLPGGRP